MRLRVLSLNSIELYFVLSLAIFGGLFLPRFSQAESYCGQFQDCRADFLKAVDSLKSSSGWKIDLVSTPLTADSKNEMVDVAMAIPQGKIKRVLLISSGTHGVEGYIGSWLQTHFLKEQIKSLTEAHSDQSTMIVLIHALNPWGFIHNRRVTANNVDLNRNFLLPGASYSIRNDDYSSLNDFLNPKSAARSTWINAISFLGEALGKVYAYGLPSLRKSVTRGQYQYSEGIFFGGSGPEPQVPLMEKLWDDRITPMLPNEGASVFAIDLHTGYGKRGKMHLFMDQNPFTNPQRLKEIFGEENLDSGKKDDFYDVQGSYLAWLGNHLKSKQSIKSYSGIAFEFGTLDSQTLKGSLKSLYRMRQENQSYHHGSEAEIQKDEINRNFVDMFAPQDEEWRNSALTQFQGTMIRIWPKF